MVNTTSFAMTSTLWGRYLRLSLLTLVVLLILLTLPALLYRKDRWHFFSESDASPRKLFHLLPINRAGSGPLFCKALMSSLVHGYSPIILNWEAEGDGSYMQRMKVAGVYEFLLDFPTLRDRDVVFMMDALDVWLQLSPQILLERYEEFGSDMVVIGADKACWPNDWEEVSASGYSKSLLRVRSPHAAMSQSLPYQELPMAKRKNAYIPSFSFVPLNEGNSLIPRISSQRPRWANSGTIIGTVKSMKELYRDLVSQLPETAFTDQGTKSD
ncbi:hypothetical protein B0H19DRAFT_130125 [Mycena capillaripes]|nr:hypothetical protein B0H19DRAFT_130125 [Mycena capillaripes]